MRTCLENVQNTHRRLLALAGVFLACQLGSALADDPAPAKSSAGIVVHRGPGGTEITASGSGSSQTGGVITVAEPLAEDVAPSRHNRTWLGLGVDEASEALSSQLGLAPGVGLVVVYVSPESPAAKAGMEKNDVLVAWDGQPLVHPAQLRKLVQVRKEGDEIEITFYRAGKKQTATAKLGKAPPGYGLLENGQALRGDLAGLGREFRDLPWNGQWHDALSGFRDQMGLFKLDQAKAQEEVRRSTEQARRALEEVLRYSTNAASAATDKALRELQRWHVMADQGSSVTVRSSGDKVKSMVKADESGTFVIVCNPKPRLTAHDKDGKLLFDGEIDTPEQRAKVPPEVWQKVEPMLDKLAEPAARPLFPKAPLPPRAAPRPARPPSEPNTL